MYTSWASYNATQTANTARPTGPISTRRYVSIPGSGVTSAVVDDAGNSGSGGSRTTTGSTARVTAGGAGVTPTGPASVTGVGANPSQSAGSGGGSSAGSSILANVSLMGVVLGTAILGTLAL
jgi:hypothetical protein